jgi:predicted trehalose synthase
MLTKAKITYEITELLNGLSASERSWALQRCRAYIQEERTKATEEAEALIKSQHGDLRPEQARGLQTRANTFGVLERVVGLLERISGAS